MNTEERRSNPALEWLDRALTALVAFAGAVGAFALLLFPLRSFPAEDAVILFQFSRNLAETGAITYIAHGPHAEGATDFLWMVLIAAAMKLHVPPFWCVAALNVTALIAMAVLLLKLAQVRVRPVPLLFVMGATVMLPQVVAAALGFSTLPFACLLVLLTFLWVRENDLGTAMAALVLCLFRPDGVVFAAPLLISALVLRPSMRRLAMYVGGFVFPGLVYFLWRWHYFGQLLPLPFLVKSHTTRVAHYLVPTSLNDGWHYIVIAAVVLALVMYKAGAERRNRALLLSLALLPTVFYLAMKLEQDVAQRFFVYLPIAVMVMVACNWQRLVGSRRLVMYVSLCLWLVLMARMWKFDYKFYVDRFHLENRTGVAQDLERMPHGTMIVTEAGLLPYFSRWTAYDAWGLNTAEFSRSLIQPSDVERIRPDMMLVFSQSHDCVADPKWRTPYQERSLENMARNLMAVGSNASQWDTWLLPYESSQSLQRQHLQPWQGVQECWYVRRDGPLRNRIEASLARHQGLTEEQFHNR